mgnify:CR=1 FL=1
MGKKYNIIYADPPWRYNARNNQSTKFGMGVHGHYPTMALDEIKKLDIKSICAPNAVLFLWITFPRLQQGLEVIEAWGFKYKTLGFSWHKLNKDKSLFFGVGSYTKSNCEVCLFATSGKVGILKKDQILPDLDEKLVVRSNYVSSAINSQREKHSKKPDEVRQRIVELFGDIPRIELFARQKTEGWDVWGNQISNPTGAV